MLDFREKATLLLFCVTFVANATGPLQGEDAPFVEPKKKSIGDSFDAFAEVANLQELRNQKGEPRITLLIEFIQLTQHDWSKLVRDDTLENDTSLRKAIEKMLNSDHASLLDMSLISTTNFESFSGESYQFHIYPRTFSPPKIDEKQGRVVPVSFSSSECWHSGFTAQGELSLSSDFSEIQMNVSPEYVGMSGESQFGKNESKVTFPTFTVHKLYSDLSVKPGEFALAGVFHAHEAAHPDRGKDLVAVFLRPTLQLVPAKSSKAP